MWGKRTGPLVMMCVYFNPPVPSRPQRRPLPQGGLLFYLSIFTRLLPTLQFSAPALSLSYSSSASPLSCFCDIRDREASAVKNHVVLQSSYSPFLANVLILGGSDAHPCLRVLHACTGTCRYFIVRCPLLYYTDNIFTLCSFGRVLLCSAVLGPQGQTCIRLLALSTSRLVHAYHIVNSLIHPAAPVSASRARCLRSRRSTSWV